MNKTFRYSIIIVISLLIASFLVFTSLAFSSSAWENNTKDTHDSIAFALPNITSDGKISYTSLAKTVNQGDVFSADFARLTTGFFVNDSSQNTDPKTLIHRDGNHFTLGKTRAIFSWYDPFENYSFSDTNNYFKFNQITSGSIYFANEDDGSITLYSVDMVWELVFLSDGKEKTKMILFPGMYFRFDPEINKDMGGFDLLRIIQAEQASPKNTAITFINPRLEIPNANKDQIIPFIFTKNEEARKLFQLLQAASEERVETVNSLKNYSRRISVQFGSDQGIANPTKRKYRLLGKLQTIFSQAVNGEIEVDDFRKQTEYILAQTKEFSGENPASNMIEQFLIDGRFALFNDTNPLYQKLYDEAAKILSINPTTEKGKMFQVLSNIFSKNLLEAKMSSSQMAIDTVNTLANTLTQSKNEIVTNDYFDISLYSFLLLRVMADENGQEQGILADDKNLITVFYRTILSRKTLEGDALYRLYSTIFNATQYYASGLSDKQVDNAQGALATDFYTPMMYLLVNSLYQTYTVNDDGKIMIANSFLSRGVPELSSSNHREIIANISKIYELAKDTFDQHIKNSSHPSAIRAKNDIQKYLAELKAFIDIVSENYLQYQKNPYKAHAQTFLPLYDAYTGQIEHFSAENEKNPENNSGENQENIQSESVNSPADTENPETERIAKILTGLAGLMIKPENIAPKDTIFASFATETDKGKISGNFDSKNNVISAVVIDGKYRLVFADIFSLNDFKILLSKISGFYGLVDKISEQNIDTKNSQIIINMKSKIIQIGSKRYNFQ